MTTLSKEDVVRMAESLGWSLDAIEVDDMFAFAILARADLVAENERISKLCVVEAQEWARSVGELREQLTATRTALAAAEARETKLRDALENHGGNYKLSKDECATINALLDAPRDDSVLCRLLAEAKAGVYEECANVCEISDRYRGDYFAAKIRELAEKAKA